MAVEIDLGDLSAEQVEKLLRNYRQLDEARLKANREYLTELLTWWDRPDEPPRGLYRWVTLNNELTATADAEEQRIVTGRQSGEALN